MSDFSNSTLSAPILETITELGFTQMTPIQAACIPLLLEGKDVVGRSQTGSGKTAAFVLPLLQTLQDSERVTQALILCPTRELSEQVVKEVRKFARKLKNIQATLIVGGQPYPPQIQALRQGPQIVVGTPGRVLEMLKNEHLDVYDLKTLVLDEADRMLDEGFSEEVSQIIDRLPQPRQTVFFSATFPESVAELSAKHQVNPETVAIESEIQDQPAIEQFVYTAEKEHKVETLFRIIQQHPAESTLIFCRTKDSVREICEHLKKYQVACRELHGDLEQKERDQALFLFRNGSLRVLVATDVAARGLDIDHLELVINFDLPINADIYRHRIGRTGRAGKTGSAVSISTGFEELKVFEFEKALKQKMIRQKLGFENQHGLNKSFKTTKMKTILISGGKKDKLRPGDILGALTAKPNALVGSTIGKIEIHDHFAYVAVATDTAEDALQKLRNEKIKGLKFKVYFIDA